MAQADLALVPTMSATDPKADVKSPTESAANLPSEAPAVRLNRVVSSLGRSGKERQRMTRSGGSTKRAAAISLLSFASDLVGLSLLLS